MKKQPDVQSASATLTRQEWNALPAEVRKKGIVTEIPISELKVSKCNVRKYVYDPKKLSQVVEISPDRLMGLAATLPKDSPVQQFVEFAASLARDGRPIQQLLARPEGPGFGVVVGKRRLLGAELAKLELLPVFVKEMTDAEAIVFSAVENIHRTDLEPLEEIELVGRLRKEGKSRKQIAEVLHKSEDWVQMRLVTRRSPIYDKEKASFDERGEGKLSEQIGPEGPSTGVSGQGGLTPLSQKPLSMQKLHEIAETAKVVYPDSSEKQITLSDATKYLPLSTLRAVLERVRENPTAPIEEIIHEVETNEPLTIEITFPIATSDGLNKAAKLLGKTVEDIVRLAVMEWLKAQEYMRRGGRPPLRPQCERRDSEHVKAMILGLCAGEHGEKQSRLLKDANICHKDWKGYYLPWMVEKKLIKTGTDSKGSVVYKATPLGEKWLADYKDAKKMLEMN